MRLAGLLTARRPVVIELGQVSFLDASGLRPAAGPPGPGGSGVGVLSVGLSPALVAGTDRWIMTGALFLTAAGLASIRAHARVPPVIAGLASIGIAASPEPVHGSVPQHLAWTPFGAVTITAWPAFTARRSPARPLILNVRGAAASPPSSRSCSAGSSSSPKAAAPWAWPSA